MLSSRLGPRAGSRAFLRHHRNRESYTRYTALVTGADTNVSRVLAKLDELGVRDKTVGLLSADQGFHCGHRSVCGKGHGATPCSMYEESVRAFR